MHALLCVLRVANADVLLQAHIHPYFPYFHLDVAADCVIFKPRPGQVLGTAVRHDFSCFITLLQIANNPNVQMVRSTWSAMTSLGF